MAEKERKLHYGIVNFERRKHPRVSINLPVEYWQAKNSKSRPAHTGDISEGGLLLYLSEEIKVGQILYSIMTTYN
jgi:c-di-GMP-binding flagellar brake protein YcgR